MNNSLMMPVMLRVSTGAICRMPNSHIVSIKTRKLGSMRSPAPRRRVIGVEWFSHCINSDLNMPGNGLSISKEVVKSIMLIGSASW